MRKVLVARSSFFITWAFGLLLTGCSQFGAATSSPEQSVFNTITCEAPDSCRVRLTWEHVAANEVGFQIERAIGSPSATFEALASTDVGVLMYADEAVAIGSSYCYRVRAFNSTGVSEYSKTACGTVTGTEAVSLTFR